MKIDTNNIACIMKTHVGYSKIIVCKKLFSNVFVRRSECARYLSLDIDFRIFMRYLDDTVDRQHPCKNHGSKRSIPESGVLDPQ